MVHKAEKQIPDDFRSASSTVPLLEPDGPRMRKNLPVSSIARSLVAVYAKDNMSGLDLPIPRFCAIMRRFVFENLGVERDGR